MTSVTVFALILAASSLGSKLKSRVRISANFPAHLPHVLGCAQSLTCESITVLLQAMKEDPPLDAKCRDKFLVQSVAVSADKEFSNVASIVCTALSPTEWLNILGIVRNLVAYNIAVAGC